MKHTHKIYARLGFLLCAVGVMLGAFGSHILRDMVSEKDIQTFDTGVRYQMIHALAIIMLALMHRRMDENRLDLIFGLFIGGIFVFSGSLYLLATLNIWGNDSFRVIGAITPVGGGSLIAAWLLLFFRGFKPGDDREDNTIGSAVSSRRSRRRRSRSSQSVENSSGE